MLGSTDDLPYCMSQLCRGGNSHGQEAKRQKDKDQTQASGEEKQTQTNELNSVRAGDCDLSINIISASSRTERSWPMERRISDCCGTSAERSGQQITAATAPSESFSCSQAQLSRLHARGRQHKNGFRLLMSLLRRPQLRPWQRGEVYPKWLVRVLFA